MTTTVLSASGTPTLSGATEPLPWESPVFLEAATHLELGNVSNSALREVIALFASEREPTLCLSETLPGAVVLRRAMNRSVDQHIRVLVSGSAADLRSQPQVLRWLASTNGKLLQTGTGVWVADQPDTPGESSDAEADLEMPTRESDVVDVVEWLARQLDVPDGDIIQAAKLKRRNWHNWKNGRRPRLDTQGHLWALLNSVRALSDMFDDGPAAWFKEGGADRRHLLTSGQHRKLVQEALQESAMKDELTNELRRQRRQKTAAGFFE